jgi:trans-aconitate methyltransferase
MSRASQSWDPRQYAERARFVSDLGMPVVDLLAPRGGERILDLGCGDGILTRKLVDLGCDVVGVDGSADMVRAAAAQGLDARLMDGRALSFDQEFDAVFSNAALHWMGPPAPVFEGVWKALRPGGRFVGECGGHGNVATILAALEAAISARGGDPKRLNPWYYASVEEYEALAARVGFRVESIALFPRPTPLPGSLVDWLETFAKAFTFAVPAEEGHALLEDVSARCEPALRGRDGHWTADYVRLRFALTKPG